MDQQSVCTNANMQNSQFLEQHTLLSWGLFLRKYCSFFHVTNKPQSAHVTTQLQLRLCQLFKNCILHLLIKSNYTIMKSFQNELHWYWKRTFGLKNGHLFHYNVKKTSAIIMNNTANNVIITVKCAETLWILQTPATRRCEKMFPVGM